MPVRGKRLVRSPDGKSITVGTSDGVALVDPAAGKVLGALDGEPTDDLSFSADARRLLGISNGMLSVWDLTTGRPIYTMGLPAGVTGTLAAIDSEFALIGPYLFDLEKECVVWKYETTAPMAAAGGRVFSVLLDNKLRMLVSAALPQPAAAAAAKAAKRRNWSSSPARVLPWICRATRPTSKRPPPPPPSPPTAGRRHHR